MKSRQLELLLYLLKTKKATHRELAETFDVSVKTIQRDVDKLSSIGIPLYCKQGNEGGVYIEQSYKLSRSFLTKYDLQVVTFALSLYDQISVNDQKTDILAKLSLIEPDFVNLLDRDASEYFVADLIETPVSTEGPLFDALNCCLDDERKINLSVNGRTLIVAPISYVLRPKGLQLYAYSTRYHLIPLNEVTDFQETEEEFERNFLSYHETKNTLK